jgi:hypothetical protein
MKPKEGVDQAGEGLQLKLSKFVNSKIQQNITQSNVSSHII